MRTLHKDVADVRVFDFSLGHLNFSAALVLKTPDCFTRLAYDKANGIVRNHNDVGIW